MIFHMKSRIVILSAFLSPLRSGAEACAEEVPLQLKDKYDFTIVTARMRNNLPRQDVLEGNISVMRIGFGFGFDKWFFPFLAPLTVRKLKPDIVHAVLETFAGLALVFCKWLVPSAKRMLTLQTTNRSFLKKMVVRSPDRVTAISSVLKELAGQWRHDQVALIPNGIQLIEIEEALRQHEKVPNSILFVGRLEPMKGIDTLLNACAKLEGEWSLRIVGDGSLRRKLEKFAASLDIADRVTFTGYIPPDQIHDEYAKAEIFCGLSRSEALGNVFLEAQAAGCAVIGTRVGGIPDIVKDGEAGLLISPDDVDAAKQALKKILDDSSLKSRFAAAGKENAKKYDWKNIADQYSSVYEALSRTS